MNSDGADDEAILARLERLGGLLFARDRAIVDELWSGLDFRLIGSERGEIAATRDALAALMDRLFSLPCRLSWAWRDRTVTRQGDLAWILAEGELQMAWPDRTERKPYRSVCILQKLDGSWRWRLFSGSEPV